MKSTKHLLLLTVLLILGVSCKKEKTVWETEWGVPIINDTLSLRNLEMDSIVVNDGMGYYMLDYDTTIAFNLKDTLTIPDTTIYQNFTIALLNLTLNPGFSFINSAEEHVINMPYGVKLGKVILEEGKINVKVSNPIPTKTFFTVILPGVSKNGIQFNQQYVAPPGTNANPGITNETIDLAGYEIDLTGLTGADWNKLKSQVSVSTDPNGPTVVITNQDITTVEAEFTGFKLAYARGYFGDYGINGVNEFNIQALNTYYESGLVDFTNTSVTFELENSIKVAAEGRIDHLIGTNNQGSTVTFSHPQIGTTFNINPATGSWSTLTPTFKTFDFNTSNSNIENYLENLSSLHSIGYYIKLNPWGNVSGGWDELFPNSDIKLRIKASAPLTIGMDNLTLRDTFAVNLNQDPAKTRITKGDIILEATNSFPYGATAQLVLLDANKNVLHTISGSEEISSGNYGSIDPVTGLMTKKSLSRFVLTEAAISDINNVKYLIVRTVLNSPNPSTGISESMPIPVGAYVAVKLRTKFTTENVY